MGRMPANIKLLISPALAASTMVGYIRVAAMAMARYWLVLNFFAADAAMKNGRKVNTPLASISMIL